MAGDGAAEGLEADGAEVAPAPRAGDATAPLPAAGSDALANAVLPATMPVPRASAGNAPPSGTTPAATPNAEAAMEAATSNMETRVERGSELIRPTGSRGAGRT